MGETDRKCRHVWRYSGERCDETVFEKAPGVGYCFKHYIRNLRHQDMDKPFRRRAGTVVFLAAVLVRADIYKAVERAAKAEGTSVYAKCHTILEEVFEHAGEKGFNPPPPGMTIERGNMVWLTALRVSKETSAKIKKVCAETGRSVYSMVQDTMEVWASQQPVASPRRAPTHKSAHEVMEG